MVDFLCNQSAINAQQIAPDMTVADWLRTKKHQKGVKEGCASGDCGACTVILGKPLNDTVVYQSVNACLLPVAALHGKHLISIEGLSNACDSDTCDNELHPVQQALVDCHASQCGFCTPGFVMSLYALYLNHDRYPGRATVIEALSGNLCRCTGYKPILAAAERCFQLPRVKPDLTAMDAKTLTALGQRPAHLAQDGRRCFIPTALEQLHALRSEYPDAILFCGATDVGLSITQSLDYHDTLIYLGNIPELNGYKQQDDSIDIGAASTYSEFLPILLKEYPESESVFKRLGSLQIRHLGTLGGSLGQASPIGDPAPLLLALSASIKLSSPSGYRYVPISDFFTGYRKTALAHDEIIAAIRIPKKPKDTVLFFHKLSKRYEDDIATLSMALLLTIKNNTITAVKSGFGGMAAMTQAAPALERAMTGIALEERAITVAAEALTQDFQPIDDVRASASYRIQAAQNMVLRSFFTLTAKAEPVRLSHA